MAHQPGHGIEVQMCWRATQCECKRSAEISSRQRQSQLTIPFFSFRNYLTQFAASDFGNVVIGITAQHA
jgi:hypothetical protein